MTSSLYFSISNHPLITIKFDDNGVVIFFLEGNSFPFILDNEDNLMRIDPDKDSEIVKIKTILEVFDYAKTRQ